MRPVDATSAASGVPCEPEGSEAARSDRRLLAWAALVAGSALLIVGVRLTYDLPDDLRYRYSTVVFAVVVSALQLAIVLRIAGRGDLREMLALRRPSWSWTRVAVIGVLIVAGVIVLVASLPFLQQGEDEGNGAPFDPDRAIPFALNAVVLVVISPVLEELMFRGLGFKLLERFGHATAIVLTGLAFGIFHGQLQQLPALAAFGVAVGYLRSRTHSVYPGIATHALLNLVGVVLAASLST
ncbi:MAG: CPBP family intramembrane metalloprotease [Actinomycetota bacterium]|nr:CPBP family intramembrane metalloprotease [Actinomycetota bacterium]